MALPSHRRIRITPAFQKRFDVNSINVFRLTLTASDAHEMPDAIFAYRELPLTPGTPTTVGVFSHVCSPVDLEDYPIGAPRVNESPPWFRLATVDIERRTREDALDAYEFILCDIKKLILGMNAADILEVQPPFWLGYQVTEPSGSSLQSEGSLY